MERKEDERLLTGRGRYMDDLEPVAGLRHAAILRSRHPHARIRGIDTTAAKRLPGVVGVVTGAEISAVAGVIPSVVRSKIRYRVCATTKTRYAGEPVAVVVADNRYIAEDALELIEVDYDPLPGVAWLEDAVRPEAPLLFEEAGTNVAQTRRFAYGDPDAAFASAARTFRYEYRYPRSIATPMETYGVISNFEPRPDRYTIWSNFQGPFVLQPLMAAALNVPGNRVRIITPLELGRQLRAQAGGLFVHGADGCGLPPPGRSGEMDGGPTRAPHCVVERDRPRRRGRGGVYVGRRTDRPALWQRGQPRRLHPRARTRFGLPDAFNLERPVSRQEYRRRERSGRY